MSARLHTWLALGLLLLAGSVTLLVNLDGASFDRWDEAAYGGMARNAIEFGSYVVPLNEKGHYAGKVFSKPPLTIWAIAGSYQLFGVNLFSMRLPFALATLLSGVIAFFWGRQMLGASKSATWFGFTWGLTIVLCSGAMLWGRRARIEPMLVFFLLISLATYAQTVCSKRWISLSWATASGLALAGAFLTKQLAVGFAALPICLYELFRLSRTSWKDSLLRLSCCFAPALLLSGSWLALAYNKVGQRLLEVMFGFSVVSRFGGLRGTVHFNHLNRIPDTLDRSSLPFPWALGIAGTLLCWWYFRRQREKTAPPHGSLLVLLYLLSAVVVLENATRSILPWYAWTLVPPTLFGCAWLAHRAFCLLLQTPALAHSESPRSEATTPSVTLADAGLGAVGAAVIAMSFADSFINVASRINLLLLLLLAASMGWWVWRRGWIPQTRWPQLVVGFAGLVGAAMLLTRLRYPTYQDEPATPGALMAAVSRAGVNKASVSTAVMRGDQRFIDLVTMFGPHARKQASPPWASKNKDKYDGRAEDYSLPNQLVLDSVERVPGATLFYGNLSKAPFSDAQLKQLLSQGPLTFEAELMGTENWTTETSDADASGGYARALSPWLSEHQGSTDITTGRTLPLPKGQYVAVFYLKWDCRGYEQIPLATISADKRKQRLRCTPGDQPEYVAKPLRFSTSGKKSIRLSVTYPRGRRLLVHDKTDVWSQERYDAEHGGPKKKPKKARRRPNKKAPTRAQESADSGPPDGGTPQSDQHKQQPEKSEAE